MNLPNTISSLRIAATPFLLVLPFVPSAAMRLLAFVLFVFAGLSDYWDGLIARRRALITNLGRMLDPLADKFLLVATVLPVYLLMQPRSHWVARMFNVEPDPQAYPFATPFGDFYVPLWVVAAVVGRELLMTLFRYLVARRGVVIAAITSAKWKTALQVIWIGGAYFWFFAATLASERGWSGKAWSVAAGTVGIIGLTAMAGAVAMAFISLAIYLGKYGRVLLRQTAAR